VKCSVGKEINHLPVQLVRFPRPAAKQDSLRARGGPSVDISLGTKLGEQSLVHASAGCAELAATSAITKSDGAARPVAWGATGRTNFDRVA